MFDLLDEIEEEFNLFGIQTINTDETKFIYQLNHFLDLNIQRQEDLDVIINGKEYCYSLYLHENQSDLEDYMYIIKNLSHQKKEENNGTSLFDLLEVSSARPLLNKYKIFQYLIKIPVESTSILLNHLNLGRGHIFLNYQAIQKISKKEKQYFLL